MFHLCKKWDRIILKNKEVQIERFKREFCNLITVN